MTPTRLSTLLLVAVAAGSAGWSGSEVFRAVTGSLPGVGRPAPALLGFLAVMLLVAARAVAGWVRDRRYEQRIDLLRVARLLALAKAAAVFGAIAIGGYLGVGLAGLEAWDVAYGRERIVLAALSAMAGAAVAAAALRLERACVVPTSPDDPSDLP